MRQGLSFELFAASPASPDQLWGLVGDLRRLPLWTDADRVAAVPDEVAEGSTFLTVDGDRELSWRVLTSGDRLIEAMTVLPTFRLGIGVRVQPDPLGSQVVLALLTKPEGQPRWRELLVDGPALRRRLDRWAARAARLATQPAP